MQKFHLVLVAIFAIANGNVVPIPDDADIQEKLKAFQNCVKCRKQTAQLVTSNSDSDLYNFYNLQWNTRKEKVYPVAYFLPNCTRDVQIAVKCGVRASLHLIPNSGGHSYEAISWGTNHTVIVDFRNMQKVELIGKSVAKVQPGALVGPINAKLWTLGKVAVPMGNCQTVGIGGHAIGGGAGYFSAPYGLTIDSLLEVEIVAANGSVFVASNEQNRDLFWAMRGSGPGYIGIATGFKLKTFNAENLKISWFKANYTGQEFVKVYTAFQKWMDWTERNEPLVMSGIYISHDNYTSQYPPIPETGVVIHSVYIYDPATSSEDRSARFRTRVNSFFPSGGSKNVSSVSYLELVVQTGYAPIRVNVTRRGRSETEEVKIGNLDHPVLDDTDEFGIKPGQVSDRETRIIQRLASLKKEQAMPRYFYAKSHFVKRRLTQNEIARLGRIVVKIPLNKNWVLINSEMGAIHSISPTEMAYVHRDSRLDFIVHAEAPETEGDMVEAVDWLREFYNAMKCFDSGESYQNYPDLEVTDYLQRFYGRNLERLRCAKREWDPRNYFINPISIR